MGASRLAAGEIVELARDEIDEFLETQLVGRIGCQSEGRSYVVPVIYVYDGGSFYVCSTEGRKLTMMRANPNVCFEVDEYDETGGGGWRSVIAEGVFEELEGPAAARALARLAMRFVARTGRRGSPAPRDRRREVRRLPDPGRACERPGSGALSSTTRQAVGHFGRRRRNERPR